MEAVFATELEPASSFFRAEYVMKGTILEVKLIERGKIEIERSCIALDGKNGSGVAAKNSGERPVCQPSIHLSPLTLSGTSGKLALKENGRLVPVRDALPLCS